MNTPYSEMQLGQLRLVVEAYLDSFAKASGEDADELWEVAMTAHAIPPKFEDFEEGQLFWAAFSNFRAKEARALKDALAPV